MTRRGAMSIGALGLVLLVTTVAALGTIQICQRLQVRERVHLWLVWSGTDREPISDASRVVMSLPDGAATLTGVVHYSNGQLRARDARDMPLESVGISVAGLSLVVEDAYRSVAGDTHRKALPPQTRGRVLLVRIVACTDDDDDYTLAYRYYHFQPGEPIELTLPYEIHLVDSPEEVFLTNRIAHRASFGPLQTDVERDLLCEDDWEDVVDDKRGWQSYVMYLSRVQVEMAMDNGVTGVRYADVSIICDGEPLEVAEMPRQPHPMWRMSVDDGKVVCEALATGTMSYTPQWKPKLASASPQWVTGRGSAESLMSPNSRASDSDRRR